jgi:hypothetical protein
MWKEVSELLNFISTLKSRHSKKEIAELVQNRFSLIRDRSVYYSDSFAIRFSYSSVSSVFSNGIISLSTIQKYDDVPFIVCIITPTDKKMMLINSSFVKKVSHSSEKLEMNNIRGTILGTDIVAVFNGIPNEPRNFEELFAVHSEFGFVGNLRRIVEETHNIASSLPRLSISMSEKNVILESPSRTFNFVKSDNYKILERELDARTNKYKNEILLAGLIPNVNIRGRAIEYIISGDDEMLKQKLCEELRNGNRLPKFSTDDKLGDFYMSFDDFKTATDIKTKIMVCHSMPKAFNIDKFLKFMSTDKTIFLVYFIGLLVDDISGKVLVPIFQKDIVRTLKIFRHWSGRNSRGVTQFNGRTIRNIIENPNKKTIISVSESRDFLNKLIELGDSE